jgi:hypothetical protein
MLAVVGGAHAAEDAAVAPDRPSVTNSAQTVPPGSLQIETGVEYGRTSRAGEAAERRLAWQGTFRLGLTDRLEVRLEGEPLVRLRGSEDETGAGDLALGLKYRFLDQAEQSRWPIGSGRTDFGIVGLASWDLPWDLSLDINAGLVAVGQSQPDGYLIQGLASASLGKQITGRLSGFVEVFFASRGERDGRHNLGFDTGVSFLLTRLVALDAAVETSLTGRGPDYAVRAGVSVRFSR